MRRDWRRQAIVDAAFRDLRLFEGYKDGANIVTVFVILCTAWLLASRPGSGARRPRIEILLVLAAIPFALNECVRPYDRPEHAAYFVGTTGSQSPNLLLQMPPAPR